MKKNKHQFNWENIDIKQYLAGMFLLSICIFPLVFGSYKQNISWNNNCYKVENIKLLNKKVVEYTNLKKADIGIHDRQVITGRYSTGTTYFRIYPFKLNYIFEDDAVKDLETIYKKSSGSISHYDFLIIFIYILAIPLLIFLTPIFWEMLNEDFFKGCLPFTKQAELERKRRRQYKYHHKD